MRRFILALVLVLALSLTGCIQKYDVTEEQDDAIAEYMAGLLLENDKDYDQNLIPMEDIKTDENSSAVKEDNKTPEVTGLPDQGSVNSNSGTDKADSQKDYTLSELIGVKDFDIQYSDYKLTDIYPDDLDNTYFSLIPKDGYRLLVIKFTVKNNTEDKKNINLREAGVNYQLDVNGITINKPCLTALENDLQYIDITIKGGETSEAVLVYEISDKADTSDINLTISRKNKSQIIEIE